MSNICPDCQGDLIEGVPHKCPENIVRLIHPEHRYIALCSHCEGEEFKLFIKADQKGMTELVGSECLICGHETNYETTFIYE